MELRSKIQIQKFLFKVVLGIFCVLGFAHSTENPNPFLSEIQSVGTQTEELYEPIVRGVQALNQRDFFCTDEHCLQKKLNRTFQSLKQDPYFDEYLVHFFLELTPYIAFDSKGFVEIRFQSISDHRKKSKNTRFKLWLKTLFPKNQRVVGYPELFPYLKVKNFFRDLRKDQNGIADLSVELRDHLKKSYHRKMKGIGRVSFETFFLARYDRIQIGNLSQIFEAQIPFLRSAQGKVLDETGKHSIILSHSEMVNLALRNLSRELMIAKNKNEWGLAQTPATELEVLYAALYTGAIAEETYWVHLKKTQFQEEHAVGLKRWGRASLGIVRSLGYLSPYTAPVVILGSIFSETYRQKKQIERRANEDTKLIRE